jgi:hypothetical protein
LEVFNFVAHTIAPLTSFQTGVNIGSTPLFVNLDNDALLDMVYVVKKDSLNPMGWKGVYLNRVELSSGFPNAGLAWASYLSTQNNGVYFNQTINCGPGSILSNVSVVQPWCNGSASGLISPSATLGTAPYTYLWSNGSTTAQLSNVPAGTYTLQVTDQTGCFEMYTTTLTDPFVITFGGVVPPTCPGGSNGQAVVNSSGCPCMFSTCQFLWENGVSGKTNLSVSEGWNTVTITHTNGCVVVDSVLVPYSAPVVTSSYLQMVSCNGLADGSIQLDVSTATAPLTFDWSNGANQATNANLAPGVYEVTVTDSRPCSTVLNFEIQEPDLLVSNYVLQAVSCTGLSDGQIIATATGGNGGYTYQVGSLVNTSGIFNNLSAGLYSLQVNDTLGCTAQNPTIAITEPNVLTLALSATNASGPGALDGTAVATVSGGTAPYQYTWSGAATQTDSMAVYLDGGWYTVVVTDVNGCSISDSVLVDVLSLNNISGQLLEVYPNPSNGLFQLSQEVEKLDIFDLQGRFICQFDAAQEVDLRHLANGTYQLVCKMNKLTQFLRIVKQ